MHLTSGLVHNRPMAKARGPSSEYKGQMYKIIKENVRENRKF